MAVNRILITLIRSTTSRSTHKHIARANNYLLRLIILQITDGADIFYTSTWCKPYVVDCNDPEWLYNHLPAKICNNVKAGIYTTHTKTQTQAHFALVVSPAKISVSYSVYRPTRLKCPKTDHNNALTITALLHKDIVNSTQLNDPSFHNCWPRCVWPRQTLNVSLVPRIACLPKILLQCSTSHINMVAHCYNYIQLQLTARISNFTHTHLFGTLYIHIIRRSLC